MCVCEDPSWSCEVTTTLKMYSSTTFSILHKIFQKIDD